MRAHKKVVKASIRIRAVQDQYDKLRAAIDASPSEEMDDKLMQQLEQAPNVEKLTDELKVLQTRLQKLNWLEEQFGKSPLKSKKTMSVEDVQNSIPDGGKVVQYVL
jgi:predicted  nucleic acid-binding Zn-ribbon protein